MVAAEKASVAGDRGRYSASLERGLVLLRCFSGERPTMGLREMSRTAQMTLTTTHRYACTLAALGYLEQDSKRRYRLGARVRDVGSAALMATGLRGYAHPLLEELRWRTRCTTVLGMLDGVQVVCVDRARCSRRERAGLEQCLRPGSRLPAYCTAMGKILLAHLPERERDARIAQMTLSEHGPNTITSPGALQRELSSVLESGVALNDREHGPEVYAIAVPVRDRSGAVMAAIGVVGHASTPSMQEFIVAVQPRLMTASRQLSVLLVDRFRSGSH
jgi:IclR family transcriptional regulator, pca regulon regulatory protein